MSATALTSATRADAPVKILHLRENPPLEQAFMLYLYLMHESVRQADGVMEHPEIQFCDGSPVQDAEFLETRGGHRFLCGVGGRFDAGTLAQLGMHGAMCNLDIMWLRLGLDQLLPHLVPIKRIISRNVLERADVAPQHGYHNSSTPHTPRHARHICSGANLMWRKEPKHVVDLMIDVFGCIEQVLLDKIEPQSAEFKADFDYRRLFLFDGFMYGAEAYFRDSALDDITDAEIPERINVLRAECEDALQEQEADWLQGHGNVNGVRAPHASLSDGPGWNFRRVLVAERTPKGVVRRHRRLAYGVSASLRAGAAARSEDADIVVQFTPDGAVIVSSREERLERAVAAVRHADLLARGAVLTPHDLLLLDRVGSCVMKDADGDDVESFSFPPHALGFSNPKGSPAVLSLQQTVDLIVEALEKA